MITNDATRAIIITNIIIHKTMRKIQPLRLSSFSSSGTCSTTSAYSSTEIKMEFHPRYNIKRTDIPSSISRLAVISHGVVLGIWRRRRTWTRINIRVDSVFYVYSSNRYSGRQDHGRNRYRRNIAIIDLSFYLIDENAHWS